MTKIKIIQDWVIIILCICGFVAHLISVSDQYFKFEIETEIETNFAEHNLVIPDLSFCNYMIDLIDEEKLKETNFKQLLIENEIINKDDEWISMKDLLRNDSTFKLFEDLFDTYTIMNELIYSSDEIFNRILFLVNNSTFIGLDDEKKCKITTYSQLRDICFSIECPYDTLPRDKYNIYTDRNTLLKSTYKNTLIRLKLNQSTLNKIKSPFVVFIFENNLTYTFKGVTLTSISLLSEAPTQYDITYQRFENQRLPPPFSTSCIDYSKSDFKSRNHAIEVCINQKTKQNSELSDKVFFGNIAYSNVRGIHFDIYRQSLNTTARSGIEKILNSIFDNCTERNPHKECYSQNFLPNLLKQRLLRNDSEFSVVHLLATTLPEIKNTAKQKFTLKSLLVFCSSVISFWFGLTIYSISYFLCEVLKIVKGKIETVRDANRRKALILKAKQKFITIGKNRVLVSNFSKDVEAASNFAKLNSSLIKRTSSFVESISTNRPTLISSNAFTDSQITTNETSPTFNTSSTTTITANSTQSNLQRARRKSSVFLNEHIINLN